MTQTWLNNPEILAVLSNSLFHLIVGGCLVYLVYKVTEVLNRINRFYKEKVSREILEQEILRRQFISQMIAEQADHIETILYSEANIVPELNSTTLTREQYHKVIVVASSFIADLLPDFLRYEDNLNAYLVAQVTRLIDAHLRKNNIQILATEETTD